MEAATATVVTSPLLVSTPPEYCYDHEYLTGYLEDALFQFSASMMKRQRLIHPPTITTSISSTHEGQYQQLSPSDCSVFPSSNDNHYHQFNYAGGGGGCSIGSMEIEKYYCSSASSSLTIPDTRARKHHQVEGSATTIDVSGTTTGVNSPPLPGSSENIDDHDLWSMTRTSEQLSGDRHHHHQHTNNKYCSSIVGGSNSWSTSGYGNEYTFGKAFMKSSEAGAAAGGSVMKHEEKKKVGLELMIRGRVAYPFATVRPVGDEDHIITLEEINRKLLMPPRRPVRHPVGKYACKPNVVSAEGSRGLSGKRVVGLTRIYTAGGKGTITIIRTRG